MVSQVCDMFHNAAASSQSSDDGNLPRRVTNTLGQRPFRLTGKRVLCG